MPRCRATACRCVPTTTATVAVTPAARSANLDLLVTLRDAAGKVLASINPVDTLNAGFSAVLPIAGTDTLAVQGTGKGDPLTTGYSNDGSVGQYQVTASVPSPASQSPVAVISASTLRGTAPLSVNFSGTGSSDVDGSIVSCAWSFGNGGSGSDVTASTVYSAPGSDSAQLQVTDNSGLSASSAVTVTVDALVVLLDRRVADIAMGLTVPKNGNAKSGAAVKVLDVNGLPVSGASVVGSWSGLVSGSATATTDSSGIARFTSGASRASSGSFVFSVNSVTRSGYAYQPATNTEASDAITR